jgi:cell division protein FtsB
VRGLLLIPALVALAAVYAAVDPDSGIGTWRRMRADLQSAEVRIDGLRDEIAALEHSNVELESDAFAIEAAIREDLELARPGERVLRLPNPRDSNPRFP